jgi:transcriptional regulator with XRE-family HTH domain
MSTVGKNIKRFREEKQVTQEELAERLSVTRQAVSNWECGRTEPDIDTLHKIALFLGVTAEELIYGEKRQYVTNITNISEGSKKVTKAGIGFGTGLAMVISYAAWESVGWAIVHGILGWIYVIYFLIKY